MNVIKATKILGLIGSFFLGGASIIAGDYIQGFGIITASLSSAGIIQARNQTGG